MNRCLTLGVLLLAGCSTPVLPDRDSRIFTDTLGQPIDGLSPEQLALFDQGREVAERAFTPSTGLGPTFNTDSCEGCHQFPVAGGSAPRYRDFFLVQQQRDDGAWLDVGTNQMSPVHNLYDLDHGHTAYPGPEAGELRFARRQSVPFFGVGLFAFVDEAEILLREDPQDRNRDGVSGRANYEGGEIGRFGVKSQATSVESFNRGAMFNQMGITSDPLRHTFPELRDEEVALLDLLVSRAHAQVSAPDEPTLDEDGVPDPEMSDADQLALLYYSTYLAAPRPAEPDATIRAGSKLFKQAQCVTCHTPRLDSAIGWLWAYTDLLVHDMGPDFAEDIEVSFAGPSEFRTAPLWGVALHGPYLHDGRAETLHDAIVAHGGEGEGSRERYLGFSEDQQAELRAFVLSLGGWSPDGQLKLQPGDRVPSAGEPGGPDGALSPAEQSLFEEGRAYFDRSLRLDEGLGPSFNADACRACHQDPVLGGAGGLDTNVIRFGAWDEAGYDDLGAAALPRQITPAPGHTPARLSPEATVVEWRQAPSILGLGALEGVSDEAILAAADPDDADGDGVSGRARLLNDGSIGRFGWKAQIPTLYDFVADAGLNELGFTIDPATSDFTVPDDGDGVADPEVALADAEALAFFLERLGAPPQGDGYDPAGPGAQAFEEARCDDCHTPELDGVQAWTDLLLHDLGGDEHARVDQEPGLLPTEFRTAPLWGIGDTAPYMHDGRAETLRDAVERHRGEADASREAFEELDANAQQALLEHLGSL